MWDTLLTFIILMVAFIFFVKIIRNKWKNVTCCGTHSRMRVIGTGCSYCSKIGRQENVPDFSIPSLDKKKTANTK